MGNCFELELDREPAAQCAPDDWTSPSLEDLPTDIGPWWLTDAQCPEPNYPPEGEWAENEAADQGADLNPIPAKGTLGSVVFYIDADNQSAQSAQDLVELFRDGFAAQVLRAVIAGNNSGQPTREWARELGVAMPGIQALTIDVPCRKDAADLALIMELGANLDRHIRRGDLAVMVSRDDLLVGAAEHAKAHGCRALAAYVDSDPPCARSARVATLLLPTPTRNQSTDHLPARRLVSTLPSVGHHAKPQSKPEPPPGSLSASETQDPTGILTALRNTCARTDKGHYKASDVGQALANLGLDTEARRHFLKNTPEIYTEGRGAKKVYRF